MQVELTGRHPGWQDLLVWLNNHGMDTSPSELLVEARIHPGAGYGLFATSIIEPSTPLFTVPKNALLNIQTLLPHYPSKFKELSAHQFLSLHLLLHRPLGVQKSSDTLFGPYISVLPRDFDDHPLTWQCRRTFAGTLSNDLEERLLHNLPPDVKNDLEKLSQKFYQDWKRVSLILQDYPQYIAGMSSSGSIDCKQNDFLWAWLTGDEQSSGISLQLCSSVLAVNTRCIFHRLKEKRSDPDNITLCPILDFANHTDSGPHMTPWLEQYPDNKRITPGMISKSKKAGFTLSSPAEGQTSVADELFLKYGSHANRTLFVEYGFVNDVSLLSDGSGQGELNVQPELENLFMMRGQLGELMKNILSQEGYWGDWTMHSSREPAYPSFRLISALRLYCALYPETIVPLDNDKLLSLWRDTILGNRDIISLENEASWREVLQDICKAVKSQAEDMLCAIKGESIKYQNSQLSIETRFDCIQSLWEERLYVASAVAESLYRKDVY